SAEAAIAAIHAESDRPETPATAKLNPDFMYKAAPTDAPLDTPSVYGVASGLRKSAWSGRPPSASTAPLGKPRQTRGSRMRKSTSKSTLECAPRMRSSQAI